MSTRARQAPRPQVAETTFVAATARVVQHMLSAPAASSNTITITASPGRVFAVIEDATTYPEWLVGAHRVTEVDGRWPEEGTRFFHRIGFGPLTVPGSTTVKRIERPNELGLRAGMGLLGEASVRFRLREIDGGTEVCLDETLTRGPARAAAVPLRCLLSAVLWGRNTVSLASLGDLVVSRAFPARER